MPTTEQAGPLSGIRVIELAMWVAGPAATGIMADWGADVVKIEAATGDPQRAVFTSVGLDPNLPVPPFEIDNRGKQSVVLDLRSDQGVDALNRLLDTADVFVTNMRPAALERLGFDHTTVCERYPRLVYGAITGYGMDGPDRDRAGYDTGAFWARSGLAFTTVPPGDLPPRLGAGAGDHQTGMNLAAGVMAKLVERSSTGAGGLVSTSLLRSGMYSVAWDIAVELRFGRRESTRDRSRNRTPLMNVYSTGDRRAFWLLCLEADRHWPKVLEAIDSPELSADPRFATGRDRVKHCEALIADLDVMFAAEPMSYWSQRFDDLDVWWAPVQSIADVIVDPQAQPGFVDMVPRDGEPAFRSVRTPVDFDGYDMQVGAVPRLGEHTADVLAALHDD